MTLNNMKTMKKERGFTIVELLIVIVVIGILAAIVIVAYNGIQNRAKTQSAQTSASAVQKKIESYNAATGNYPTATTYATYTTALDGQVESAITSSGIVLSTPTGSSTGPGPEKRVMVERCTTANATGYRLSYWDFGTGLMSTNTITGGTNSVTCAAWSVLT